LGGKISQLAFRLAIFVGFAGLAQPLNSSWRRHRMVGPATKGRLEMPAKSQFTRTLIAAVGALLVSSIAVGAAVGPAQAVAKPVQVSVNV
jgi:hypothetical protein